VTRSVTGGVPTRSVGTIIHCQAVEGLGRLPTLVDSNIGMRDALQIRYQTGNKLG